MITIPNAGFEDDSNWSFTGTGGIAARGVNFSFLGMGPRSGARMAYLSAWTTSGNDCAFPATQITGTFPAVTAAQMSGTVTVSGGDEGFYSLEGFAHGAQEGFGDHLSDACDLGVWFDDAFWGYVGFISGRPFPYTDGWLPFNFALTWGGLGDFGEHGARNIYWSPGSHSLTFSARTRHVDALGDPLPIDRRQIVILDDLSLQPQASGVVLPGTHGPLSLIRLTHAPGAERVRLSVRARRTIRLVHHG